MTFYDVIKTQIGLLWRHYNENFQNLIGELQKKQNTSCKTCQNGNLTRRMNYSPENMFDIQSTPTTSQAGSAPTQNDASPNGSFSSTPTQNGFNSSFQDSFDHAQF